MAGAHTIFCATISNIGSGTAREQSARACGNLIYEAVILTSKEEPMKL